MGKLRVEAQSTASRISSKTAAQQPTTTIDREDLASNGEIADATAYNVIAPDPHDSTCLPDLLEVGDTVRGKPAYGLLGDADPTKPGDQNVYNQMDSGLMLDVTDGIITYGFLTQKHATGLVNNPQFGEGKGYSPFSAAQIAAAKIAIANWDEYIQPEFVEVKSGPGASGWGQNRADIWLANTSTGPAQAWAYFPGYGNQYTRIAGDVWIADPNFNGSNAQLDPGFYGLQTLNHELGHSLGFSHPGDYDFGDDSDGDGQPDPITYEGDAFYAQDNHQYTIMSYFDSFEVGNNQVDWNFMRFVYPSTPMVHDVWAAQHKYGVETNTRVGDTTYGFNATGDVANDAMRFEAGEMATIFTIFDSNGVDTLDLSGYHTDSVIDLREGGYSSAGGWGSYRADLAGTDPAALSKNDYLAIVNGYNSGEGFASRTAAYDLYFGGRAGANEGIPWSTIMGNDYLMENNIGIAYGAIVENAIGGHGDDRINGNQANNQFTGNAGADTFIIADYSGVVTRPVVGNVTIDDESEDTIMDFDRTEGDKISLCDLDVDYADLSFSAVTGGTRVTVERGDDDLSFIVLGTTPLVEADFLF